MSPEIHDRTTEETSALIRCHCRKRHLQIELADSPKLPAGEIGGISQRAAKPQREWPRQASQRSKKNASDVVLQGCHSAGESHRLSRITKTPRARDCRTVANSYGIPATAQSCCSARLTRRLSCRSPVKASANSLPSNLDLVKARRVVAENFLPGTLGKIRPLADDIHRVLARFAVRNVRGRHHLIFSEQLEHLW